MLVHLNGQLLPHDRAAVSVFDRGFLLGDGVFEGLRAYTPPPSSSRAPGAIIAMPRHVRRMQAGLDAVAIDWDAAQLPRLTAELLAANRLADAFVYWQITRGTPDLAPGPVRSRVPVPNTPPTVFGYASPIAPINFADPTPAAKRAITAADRRWLLGHVKSISLLGNLLASIDAAAASADEAIFIRDADARQLVTEGTYTNVMIARRKPGSSPSADPLDAYDLATPDLESAPLLDGVTRQLLLALEPRLKARPVTRDELLAADEVLLLGTTTMVTTITHLDGKPVADARPGPVAQALMRMLTNAIAAGKDE
jgi:D-alanine transaminase